MRDVVEKMTGRGIHVYVAGGRLKVRGELDDIQRQYIKQHTDELKACLTVDVEKYLKVMAVGLPVDHEWLMDCFFTSDDLTLISLGDYLGGDIEQSRDEIRQHLTITPSQRDESARG